MTHTFKHPKYWAELRKERRAQASKLTSYKLPGPRPISNANKGLIHRKKFTSSQASEHKPSSPEPRGQASSPRNSVPGSGIQGTSESVQASGNRKQG